MNPIKKLFRKLRRLPTWEQTQCRIIEASIVRIARSQIGEGEDGNNNAGKAVAKYMDTVGRSGLNEPWCAGFVSWCLVTAADRIGQTLKFKPAVSSSAKRLVKNVIKIGHEVDPDNIEPGHIICWHRGTKSWQGHVGIVVAVVGNSIKTIEGNVGTFPAKVSEFTRHDWRKGLYKIGSVCPRKKS